MWEKSHLLCVMRTTCTLLCISTLYHGQPLLPKKHLMISGVGKEFLIYLIFIFSPSLSYSLVFPIPFWVEYLFLVSHPMLVNVEKLLLVTTQMTYCLFLNFLVFTTLYFLWKYNTSIFCDVWEKSRKGKIFYLLYS